MPLEKKKSKSVWTDQGGSLENSGMIHKNDIFKTLKILENDLSIDLIDNLLGSGGKREFSGDIDVAISDTIDKVEFLKKIKENNRFVSVRGVSPISTLVKIESQNVFLYEDVPYTGYVQLDFIFGNPQLLKLYYHSPFQNESKYKGTYRNIFLSSICSRLRRHETVIYRNTPVKSITRYKWSPVSGLTRVVRIHEFDDKRGVFKKKHNDCHISKSHINKLDVASVLNLSGPEKLESFESLLFDIYERYDQETVNSVIEDFVGSLKTKKMKIPDEIK